MADVDMQQSLAAVADTRSICRHSRLDLTSSVLAAGVGSARQFDCQYSSCYCDFSWCRLPLAVFAWLTEHFASLCDNQDEQTASIFMADS